MERKRALLQRRGKPHRTLIACFLRELRGWRKVARWTASRGQFKCYMFSEASTAWRGITEPGYLNENVSRCDLDLKHAAVSQEDAFRVARVDRQCGVPRLRCRAAQRLAGIDRRPCVCSVVAAKESPRVHPDEEARRELGIDAQPEDAIAAEALTGRGERPCAIEGAKYCANPHTRINGLRVLGVDHNGAEVPALSGFHQGKPAVGRLEYPATVAPTADVEHIRVHRIDRDRAEALHR